MASKRRALGIVRVSQVAGREGDSFASPSEQRARIVAACVRDGLELVPCPGAPDGIFEELDVSGGKPLDERQGLREAVEAIERGEAEVVVAAYFDRLFRSLGTQAEVVQRVESAGGQVLAIDVGTVSNESAGQWLSATLLGAVAEYARRTGKERSGAAQARAIARGVPPWGSVTPGYRRAADRTFEVDPNTAPLVAEAYARRAAGATLADVRSFLASSGITLSYRGVQTLLCSRVVLGEIHFGKYTPNLNAHPAIVDRALWARVQRTTVSRGRRASSDRLLARLGVLRCASCGSAMIAATQTQQGRRYPFYRCGRVRQDCDKRPSISAVVIESMVVDAVRARLANVEGRASTDTRARDMEIAAEQAQADLDSAIRTLATVSDEAATVQRLTELREARDAARDQFERLRGTSHVAADSRGGGLGPAYA